MVVRQDGSKETIRSGAVPFLTAADAPAAAREPEGRQPAHGEAWMRKRKIGRLKVSRSIDAKVVRNLTEVWRFARTIGLDCNRFVTVRPEDIDSLTPRQRIRFWQRVLNKIAQFARDHAFECVHIWAREAARDTGRNEHLHVLTHIPPRHLKAFETNVAGWLEGTTEIHTRRADYRVRLTHSGKQRDAIGYVTKDSPQAAFGRPREYRLGGPILGKRVGCSRNIDVRARARYEVKRAIQREFGARRTEAAWSGATS